jgi:prolyl-tRNA synthetase
MCEAPLAVEKTIEIGHIFKLGTRYSEVFGATVLDENGVSRPIVMGSYGIGIERTMAAVAECRHDDAGLQWPLSVAPFEVVITVIKPKDVATMEAGSALYDALVAEGIDALLDDRDERPGVKFKDADLIGVPFRVTVGPRGLAEGEVEVVRRSNGESQTMELTKAGRRIAETILEERSMGPQV